MGSDTMLGWLVDDWTIQGDQVVPAKVGWAGIPQRNSFPFIWRL